MASELGERSGDNKDDSSSFTSENLWFKEVIERVPHFTNLTSDLLFMVSVRSDPVFFVFSVTINILQIFISFLMGWLKLKLSKYYDDERYIDVDAMSDLTFISRMFYFGTIGPQKTFKQSIKFIKLLAYGNDFSDDNKKTQVDALEIIFHVLCIDTLQLMITITYSNQNGYTPISIFSVIMSLIMICCVGVPGLMCHIYYVTCS